MGFMAEEMRSIQRWTAPWIRRRVLATLDAKQKIHQKAKGFSTQAAAESTHELPSLFLASPIVSSISCLPPHLAGDKAIKVIDIIGTMPNFGIAFTIWRTPLCPHLYYTHTNINTLLGCTKLSGWESMP